MLVPRAIDSSIALTPAPVAGILISRLGRSIQACSRSASSTLASRSSAKWGSISQET